MFIVPDDQSDLCNRILDVFVSIFVLVFCCCVSINVVVDGPCSLCSNVVNRSVANVAKIESWFLFWLHLCSCYG
jgi:hypothetical protein